MAKRSRMGVLKRQRELKKAEKAELKREKRRRRSEASPASPESQVPTREDLAEYGVDVEETEQGS